MAFLEWNDTFVLGVEEVDEQHQHLFELVNRLHGAVTEGAEQSELSNILDSLIDYTVDHFETEEKLFKEHNYPQLEEHKKEHDDLTGQVVDLQTKFREGSATLSFEVLDFLSNWLTDHTTNSDLKFATFMNK